MPEIKCAAVTCLHNKNEFCTVSSQIDMRKGIDMYGEAIAECLDHAPVSDEEYYLITGKTRVK